MNNDVIKGFPAVFAVGDTYHIMVQVKVPCTMWVKVGNEEYFDDSNGVLKSDVVFHRMIVPKEELEHAKKYTVCFRKIIERVPYYSKLSDVSEESFDFFGVEDKDEIRAYHISDAHYLVNEPVRAAEYFEENYGKIDFLILNGDVPEGCDDISHFNGIYDVTSALTKGNKPVVFARGNHDMRGKCAEKLADCTPTDNGKSYFTFTLGNIFGLVLDCGEDKPDDSCEYGYTICCHNFRKKQTRFIENVIEQKAYECDKIKHKVVVCHHPFTTRQNPPFDIEKDLYAYWAKIIKEGMEPELMICGHMHRTEIIMPGDERDALGQPCPIVVGAKPTIVANPVENKYVGTGYVFRNGSVEVVFTDSERTYSEKHLIEV